MRWEHAARRAGRMGALVGAGVAVISQLIVWQWGDSTFAPEPLIRHRLLAILLAAALYGGVALAGAALAYPLWSKRSRAVPVVVTTLLSVMLCLHVVGVGVRLMSGTHVTMAAIQFCISSWEHFLHAGFRGYAQYSVPVVLGTALIWWLSYRMFHRRPLVSKFRARRELFGQVGWVGALALLTLTLPVSANTRKGLASTLPELAFLESLSSKSDIDLTLSPMALTALESPPLAAGAVWRRHAAMPIDEPPNVLILTLESVGAQRVGYLGYKRDVTPNLDRVAARGVSWTRAWTTATHSNYSQMAILSSLIPRRGSTLDMYQRIDYPRVLLADLLAPAGYASGTISSQDETWQGMYRFQQTKAQTYYHHAPDHAGERLDTGTEMIVPDHLTAEKVATWIHERSDSPWSLYVNFQATHFPYLIPDDAPHPYRPYEPEGSFNYLSYPEDQRDVVINRYDNALSYVDAQIGVIEKALKDSGQLGRTIWVISSDHGEQFHEHGMVTHGRSLYDSEARVPLVLHYPDGLKPEVRDEPVSQLDIMPTVAALVGVEPHPAFQGKSLLDASVAQPRPIYLNIQGWSHAYALVCYPYKLIVDVSDEAQMLFNLALDPNELHDLHDSRPTIASALGERLQAQMSAQDHYHSTETGYRFERYAPRTVSCPKLGGEAMPDRAQAMPDDVVLPLPKGDRPPKRVGPPDPLPNAIPN